MSNEIIFNEAVTSMRKHMLPQKGQQTYVKSIDEELSLKGMLRREVIEDIPRIVSVLLIYTGTPR